MKIIFVSDAVYPYFVGGREKRLYEISKRLVEYGHEVHIFTMKWWKGASAKIENGVVLHGVCKLKSIYTEKERRRSLWQAFYFGIKVFFPLLREKFDIFDADQIPYFHLIFCKIVCLLKRKKLIVTWHEVWGKEKWFDYLGKFKGFFSYWIEKLAVKMPDRIIAVSDTTAERLRKILKIKKEKIIVIPNGINIEEINKAPRANLKSDCIFAGRLIKHKNVDYLIKAIKIIKQKYKPNIKCIIIGDGPEKEELKKQTKNLDLENNIKFLGFLGNQLDVFSYFKTSQVFVSPSTNEGFGITVLEANACGLPAVVINHPDNATRDLIIENKNGYVVNLNINEIAEKIIDILKNIELWNERIGNHAIILKKYSWDNLAKNILSIYQSINNLELS
ncbi:MAG: glycosyltransferase family 4 protein [Patescibacteria group bacterium]